MSPKETYCAKVLASRLRTKSMINPDRLNSYLTVGANVAVLIGLIFVGLELRNSGAAVSSQASANIASGFNQINMQLASEPALASIVAHGSADPTSLTIEEAIQYSLITRSVVNQYTQLLHLRNDGLLSEDQWAIYAREAFHILSSPGGKVFVDGNAIAQELLVAVRPYSSRAYSFDDRLGRELRDK